MRNINILALALMCILLFPLMSSAQTGKATLSGTISADSSGRPFENLRIRINNGPKIYSTDEHGHYSIVVPAGQKLLVDFIYLNHLKQSLTIGPLGEGEQKDLSFTLREEIDAGPEITIKGKREPIFMMTMDSVNNTIPNASGGIEGQLKLLPGFYSNNELSSQYSVRGGNFDENLVYINDIEIYRPQLVRSGQEEGLSIINPDLVQNLRASAGGFEARYGDKLSSVLDITYKEPDTLTGSVSASLLGGAVSLGGTAGKKKFKYLAGARYRTNAYLLNSLDVQGAYQTHFTDGQVFLTYDVSKKLKLSSLTYFGGNKYLSVPQSQETTFGTVTSAIRLNVDFEGQQILKYNTLLQGITATYDFNKDHWLKWIASVYNSDENEDFDVIGNYDLEQLDNDQASKTFGQAKYSLGYGGYLNHGRNSLNSLIYNTELKGGHSYGKQLDLEWGVKFQREQIQDQLSEYKYVDSADYSVPQGGAGPRTTLPVYEYIYSNNAQIWNRYMGYVQNTFTLNRAYRAYLVAGMRFNYWDYNKEMLYSPRLQFYFEPNAAYNTRMANLNLDSVHFKKNIRIKAAAGVYDQSPFYRELRDLYGQLNPNIRAQKSLQFVAGTDLNFRILNRRFKWTTEVYYKHLTDLIPYEIEDVRVRYLATNNAVGYAAGVDFMLNGEVVKDNPSWLSLSIMKTAQDILDDVYSQTDPKTGVTRVIHPGYLPRPTDQRVKFSMYFQDYLPKNPTYKVHLSLIFATGLPFGPPMHQLYRDTLRMPPYRRVDIGFSKQLYDKSKMHVKSHFIHHFQSIWIGAEIFNMFAIDNTLSYLWVQDVSGNQYAVPNYLTGRRLNFRLEVKF